MKALFFTLVLFFTFGAGFANACGCCDKKKKSGAKPADKANSSIVVVS